MIVVKDLKKNYNGLDVLKGIDLTINKGDVVCLVGPSGCGKSTFLRCLTRLEEPDGGTVMLDGKMVGEVLELMKELARDGMTMVVVTHEMGFAREVANRVIFIDEGVIKVDKPPQEFFENPDNPRL